MDIVQRIRPAAEPTQKTCCPFQHKVRKAICSKEYPVLTGKIVADEFVVGGPEKGKRGRSKGQKKEVVMAYKA